MAYVDVNGIQIYYEVHGSGTPLLLVAGLGGAGSYWKPQVETFAKHFRVVLHDHRGTGRSTHHRTKYSVEQMADDVVRLMDELGIDKAHFVGHSTGGAIGQVLAIDHPDRLHSAVLYATWTKADPFMKRIFDIRKRLVLDGGAEAYVRATPLFLYPDWWINGNPAELDALDRSALASFPPAEIAASRADALIEYDRVKDLGLIRTPTLVLCAKDDYLTPSYFSRELFERIPDAELAILEKGGHACSQTVPQEFNALVLRYLLAQEMIASNGRIRREEATAAPLLSD